MKKSTKRKLAGLTAAFTIAVSGMLVGCQPANDGSSSQNRQPSEMVEQVRENAQEICHIKVRLKQSRWSINPLSHAKDAMNATVFELPTACDIASGIHNDDDLMGTFRKGSFFLRGSLSSWKLTADEVPQFTHTDDTAYRVKLRLHQSRVSTSIIRHIKDWSNAVEFYWDVPKAAYDKMNVDDDIIKGGFRWGSLLTEGTTSAWSLDVVEKVGQVRPPKPPAPGR